MKRLIFLIITFLFLFFLLSGKEIINFVEYKLPDQYLNNIAFNHSHEITQIKKFKIFAHYYGWYDEDKWNLPYTNNPILGEYKTTDKLTIQSHISWAKRAGLGGFSISWHGKDSITDKTLREAFIPQLDSEDEFYFFAFVETPDILGISQGKVIDFNALSNPTMTYGDKFIEQINYLANSYFHHPKYYRIGQKPVVFIYLVRDMINYEKYFEILTAQLKDRGIELYMIADVIAWQNPNDGISVPEGKILNWNFLGAYFSAITGYNMFHPKISQKDFLNKIKEQWRLFKNKANEFKLDFLPFIFPGYDDRKLRGANREIIARSSEFYKEFWKMLHDNFIESKTPLVLLTSFNEWHEGTEIEPSAQYGFDYLDLTNSFGNFY